MNNNYLKRHTENLESAKLLIYNHSHYCSSVHCSYYAVFQYLLHFHKVRDSRIFKDRDRLGNVGSHDLIIKSTFAILQEIDTKNARYFDREMRALKALRVEADYKEVHIDRMGSIVAFETAQDLTRFLSKLINI